MIIVLIPINVKPQDGGRGGLPLGKLTCKTVSWVGFFKHTFREKVALRADI